MQFPVSSHVIHAEDLPRLILKSISISVPSFPGSSEGKVSACSVGDLGSIPGSGRSPGEGNGDPLWYWKIPWTEKPGAGYSPWGHKESDTTEQLHFLFTFQFQVLILYQYTQKRRGTEVKEVGSLGEVKFICSMLRLSFVIPFLLCSAPLLTFGDNFKVLKRSPVLFITNQSGNIIVEETGCFSIHLACKEP